MVRVKLTEYSGKPSIAIFFENVTQHVKKLRAESSLLEELNKNQSLESFTSTMSHEFSTPLSTSIMILEKKLSRESAQDSSSTRLVLTQLSLLLSLVNDMLDLKLIRAQ